MTGSVISLDRPPEELVEETNSQVGKRAVKYVYGIDDTALEFVGQRISAERTERLVERLRARRKQKRR